MTIKDFKGVLPDFINVAVCCDTHDNKENEKKVISDVHNQCGTSFGSLYASGEDPWYFNCEIVKIYSIRTENTVYGTTICFLIKCYDFLA